MRAMHLEAAQPDSTAWFDWLACLSMGVRRAVIDCVIDPIEPRSTGQVRTIVIATPDAAWPEDARWTLTARDTDALVRVIQDLVRAGATLYAWDGRQTQLQLQSLGVDVRGILSIETASRVLAPKRHEAVGGRGWGLPAVVPSMRREIDEALRAAWEDLGRDDDPQRSLGVGWRAGVARAVEGRPSIHEIESIPAATAAHYLVRVGSAELANLADDEMRHEELWREAARRGYRVDVDRVRQREAQIVSARSQAVREYGIDLTANDTGTRRWLARRGITILDPAGKWSYSREHYDEVYVPQEAADDWASFRQLRDLAADAGKITEILGALHGERVYPTIRSMGLVTGRMSITGPALQNLSPSMREGLLADDGHVLVGCDLDRVEPRILAALSGDEALGQAVRGDLYTDLAKRIADSDDVSAVQRSRAKRTLLGIMYGMGPDTLAQTLCVERDEAVALRRSVLQAYPQMGRYLRDLRRRAEEGEPLTTALGRPLPPTDAAPYKAIAWTIQGSAKDVFTQMCLHVADRIDDGALWLPVHDELVLQVRDDPEAVNTAIKQLEIGMRMVLGTVEITGTPRVIGARFGHA